MPRWGSKAGFQIPSCSRSDWARKVTKTTDPVVVMWSAFLLTIFHALLDPRHLPEQLGLGQV
jgi:hypothetical protein